MAGEKAEAGTVTIRKTTLLAVVFIAVAFVVGFGAGSMSFGGLATSSEGIQAAPAPAAAAPPTQPVPPERVQVSLEGLPVEGDPNAPVTIIEYSDFECPFCARFYQQTLPALKAQYIDTGKARIAYAHFPLQFHPQAEPAALASECADEQGRFWDFHDLIFENQQLMSPDTYKQWADDLGLNTDQFDSCFDSGKFRSEVQSEFSRGQQAGVSGTPTFFIGSPDTGYTKLVGAQPINAFQAVIDAELS